MQSYTEGMSVKTGNYRQGSPVVRKNEVIVENKGNGVEQKSQSKDRLNIQTWVLSY